MVHGAEVDTVGLNRGYGEGEVGGLAFGGFGFAELCDELAELGGGGAVDMAGLQGDGVGAVKGLLEAGPVAGVGAFVEHAAGIWGDSLLGKRGRREVEHRAQGEDDGGAAEQTA